jgi:hypothetical protein
MTQYIGQITVILETETSELASQSLNFLASQLDDTSADVVFADHNGEIEDYEEIERECEESVTTQAKRPLLAVLLASLEKCTALLANYDEHPGEEGIAYREAIAAIVEAEAAGITPAPAELDIQALLAERRQVAVIWCIEDVQGERPALTEDQCWQVLEATKRYHDATIGINWDVLRCHADLLFDSAPATDEAEGE